MIILPYASKKKLTESVGKPLRYSETSIFGEELPHGTGKVCGCNRPTITRIMVTNPKTFKRTLAREFFAEVTVKDGILIKVK